MNKLERIYDVLYVHDPLKLKSETPDWIIKVLYGVWAKEIVAYSNDLAANGAFKRAFPFKDCRVKFSFVELEDVVRKQIGEDKNIYDGAKMWCYPHADKYHGKELIVKVLNELSASETEVGRMFRCQVEGPEQTIDDFFEEELGNRSW